ncbi:MAG: glycosyltransferase family A protein [Spirochaetaceae bacterium]|jgi:glycosyltransferase involved in cell wall biosynthesis|nr:glycosyltransferase family A protein [Spirochaetaceae bacterium]
MISLIIPSYNRLDLLKEAMDSVARQTWTDWELILVDDGSTDATASWADHWFKSHPGRFLQLEHRGFPGRARNRGVEASAGEWIAFLDSDDLWKPEKLYRQMEAVQTQPHLRIWHCREIWQREGRIISQKAQKHQRQGSIFNDALKKCIIGPSTVMIHREFWQQHQGFREDLQVAEDYELWQRMTCSQMVGYLDEPLTVKRAGKWDQLSERYGQIEIFRIQGLQELVESLWFSQHCTKESQQQAQEELARKCLIYAEGCKKRAKKDEAVFYEKLANKWSCKKSN